MQTYRAIFGVREFRVLFGVRTVTMLGLMVSSLAIGTVIFDQTGSPLLTSVALFGGPLVQLLTSHFLLAGADLMRPRTAMVLAAATAGVTDLLQLIPDLAWWGRFGILAVGYVIFAATSGTVIALLSDIVPRESFVLARATLNITVGGSQILGYAIGAILLNWRQPTGLFWISGGLTILAAALIRWRIGNHPPRAEGNIVVRTQAVNRQLLSSPVIRPVLLMMWIPNGLIVGCEAMFIPYAGQRGGYLLAATAAGMLAGDVVIGRFIPEASRDRLILPLRILLAVPFLFFVLRPTLAVACVLSAAAAFGYPAALPLQERLVDNTEHDVIGQVFGLAGTGTMIGQSAGAMVAGVLADVLGSGSRSAATTMTVMAVLSLAATAVLIGGLRRSTPVAAGIEAA